MGTDLYSALSLRRAEVEKAAVTGWDVGRQFDHLAQLVKGDIRQCWPDSVFASVLQAAQGGLSLNPAAGHAWLVAEGKNCRLIKGYKGLRHQALKWGGVTKVVANLVLPGEVFRVDYFHELLVHEAQYDKAGCTVPPGPEEEAIAAYAKSTSPDGSVVQWRLLWRSQLDATMKRALDRIDEDQRERSPWRTHWAWMARKTALSFLLHSLDLPEPALELLQDKDREEPGPVKVVVVKAAPAKAADPAPAPPAQASGAETWEAVEAAAAKAYRDITEPAPAPTPPAKAAEPKKTPARNPHAPVAVPPTKPAEPPPASAQASGAGTWEADAAKYGVRL